MHANECKQLHQNLARIIYIRDHEPERFQVLRQRALIVYEKLMPLDPEPPLQSLSRPLLSYIADYLTQKDCAALDRCGRMIKFDRYRARLGSSWSPLAQLTKVRSIECDLTEDTVHTLPKDLKLLHLTRITVRLLHKRPMHWEEWCAIDIFRRVKHVHIVVPDQSVQQSQYFFGKLRKMQTLTMQLADPVFRHRPIHTRAQRKSRFPWIDLNEFFSREHAVLCIHFNHAHCFVEFFEDVYYLYDRVDEPQKAHFRFIWEDGLDDTDAGLLTWFSAWLRDLALITVVVIASASESPRSVISSAMEKRGKHVPATMSIEVRCQ